MEIPEEYRRVIIKEFSAPRDELYRDLIKLADRQRFDLIGLRLPVIFLFGTRNHRRALPLVKDVDLDSELNYIKMAEDALLNGRYEFFQEKNSPRSLNSLPSVAFFVQAFGLRCSYEVAEVAKQEIQDDLIDIARSAALELWTDDHPVSESLLRRPLWRSHSSCLAILPLATLQIVRPIGNVSDGQLIEEVCIPWLEIAGLLKNDPYLVSQISPRKWEEIVAGAFDRSGYDEVILTPRSNDFGKDVIATKKGFGTVKIIGSVKAYGNGRKLRHEDIRELVGALHMDQSASKGVLVTTGDLPRDLEKREDIEPLLPTRLEIVGRLRLADILTKISSGLQQRAGRRGDE